MVNEFLLRNNFCCQRRTIHADSSRVKGFGSGGGMGGSKDGIRITANNKEGQLPHMVKGLVFQPFTPPTPVHFQNLNEAKVKN